MRKILFLLPLLTAILSGQIAYSQVSKGTQQKDVKVALVLCGGGAKGVAHIGALKKIEEVGIRPDLIVGTSMGALVGGMYAMGYSANQLDSIVSNSDWNYLLSDEIKRSYVSFSKKKLDDVYLINLPFYNLRSKGQSLEDISFLKTLPAGYVSGNNVLNLLNGLAIGYQDSLNFKDLPISFACIATDLSTGEEVVLDRGSLPLALRASMAIPGFFAPVEIDGKVLVDGGVVNNFPVDIARKMGANVIIGIDVQNDLSSPENLKSIDAVLLQLVGLLGNEKFLENKRDIDIYIKPDVSEFGTLSFNPDAVATLMTNGYEAAQEVETELVTLKNIISKSNRDNIDGDNNKAKEIYKSSFKVGIIETEGVDDWDKKWLLNLAGLKDSSVITGSQINRAISIFNGTKAFSNVTYKLSLLNDGKNDDTYKLLFSFTQGPTNVLSLGARYDSEEAAALLLHLGVHQYDFHGSKLDFTTRLSYSPYIKLSYSYLFRKFPRFDIEYEFSKRDVNIYSNKNSRNNLEYIYNAVDVGFANIKYVRYFDIKMGAKFQNYNFTRILTSIFDYSARPLKAKNYLSTYIEGFMDTRDNKTFPSSGSYLEAKAAWYFHAFHPNFKNIIEAQINFESALHLGNNFVLLPQIYSRTAFRNPEEAPLRNFIGGSHAGRYIAHQMPFIGINYANLFDNSVTILRGDIRKKIGKNHYIYAIANYLRHSEHFHEIFNKNAGGYWGFGAQYSFDSPLGPISFNVHWSDYNKNKVGAYLSLGYFF